MYPYRKLLLTLLAGLILVSAPTSSYANSVAGKLEGEKPLSGVITGTGVDSYTFPVAPGSSFMVSVSETGNHVDHFSPSLKLIGPDKQVTNEYSKEIFVRLANMGAPGGEWKVEVSRQDAGTSGGSYKIMLTQVPGAKGTLMEVGKSYTGAIIRGSVDVYTISGTVGGKAQLSMTPKEGTGVMLATNVLSPSGQPIAGNDCKEICNTNIDMKETGNYTALIWRDDQNDNKGAYSVSLQGAGAFNYPLEMNNAAAKGIPLQGGQQYTGSITGGAIHVYTLSNEMGGVMELTLTPQGFSPMVTAFGPDGELIGTERCSALCHLDLPPMRPGTYKVMLWRKDQDGATGAYTLSVMGGNSRDGRVISLLPSNPSDPSTVSPYAREVPPTIDIGPKKIENGKPVTASIKGEKTDSFTFKATKGSSFMISLSKKGAANEGLPPMLQIFGPDNQLVGSQGGLLVATAMKHDAAAGDWRIELGKMGSFGGGSDYDLRLLQIPGASGTPMEFGKLYDGTIIRGSADVYTINGTQDVTGLLSVVPKSGKGFMPQVNIFTPTGAMVSAGGGVGAARAEVPMKDFGIYTVVVSRIDQDDTKGVYSLSVIRKGDKPVEPELDAASIYRNVVDPVWPEDTMAMRPQAAMYLSGVFLNFSSRYDLTTAEHKLADDGDVATLVYFGDHAAYHSPDGKSGATWWKKAADQGSADARNRLAAAGAVDSAGKKYEPAAWYRFVLSQVSWDPDVKAANAYLTGVGENQDLKQAEKLYKAAAEKGITEAQFNLAALYTLGIGGKVKYAEAAKWYGKAAAQGLVVAENNLGELSEHGQGVKQDDAGAAKWYLKAAESGYPQAQYNLARLLAAGRGMPKDAAKAAEWLKKASDGGHMNAQAELAALEGKSADAIRLWRKMALGDKASLRRLVETARTDGIDPADYEEILEVYRSNAKDIDPQAFLGLADLFTKQNPPDDFEAYFWYSLAVDTAKTAPIPPDERKAVAAYAAGEAKRIAPKLSPEQIAVTKWRIKDRNPDSLSKAQEEAAPVALRAYKQYEAGDNKNALMFFIQAAHLGVPRAQSFLCSLYLHGSLGLGQNTMKAIDYCKQSIRGGLTAGATMIGDMYLFGIAVPVDYETAAKWYELDASRGYKKARDRLAWIYLYRIAGSGKRALALYEKSAAKGDLEADDALGMIYLYGMGGVQKDIRKALKWYLRAADRNEPVGSIQAAAILKNNEPRDYARAVKLLTGTVHAVMLNNLAFMYEQGLGAKVQGSAAYQASHTAMALYKQAADMCYGRAMYNIGRLYETGASSPAISATPVQKDLALARKWMESAAVNGSAAAALWLEVGNPDTKISEKVPQEEVGFDPEPCKKEGRKQ
ncbi:MAG: tetratricopeptide repeat protein [Alphaproteobacteria bacterium]